MIITRTPLRISYAGGGTDLPGYSLKYGGLVISTTINKYVYVTLNHKFDGRVHLRYSKTESVDGVDELRHGIVRECLKMFGIEAGVEITIISDVPMVGTGLGSSSALTVGLIEALAKFVGDSLPRDYVAENASIIEINRLEAPIGKQDQYAAAFGGFNTIHFMSVQAMLNTVSVTPVNLSDKVCWLEDATMLFWLGPRRVNTILDEQTKEIEDNLETYHLMRNNAQKMRSWLTEDTPYNRMGEILQEGWELKKSLSPDISNDEIEQHYNNAIKAGALGGKVCGAGGGGFLMLIVPKDRHVAVREALSALDEMSFRFSPQGSEVIYSGN